MAILESQDPDKVDAIVIRETTASFNKASEKLEESQRHAQAALLIGAKIENSQEFQERLTKAIRAIWALRGEVYTLAESTNSGKSPSILSCLNAAEAMRNLQLITIEKVKIRAEELGFFLK